MHLKNLIKYIKKSLNFDITNYMKICFVLLLCVVFLTGCTKAILKKEDIRKRLTQETIKEADYIYLAKYWDDHAEKLLSPGGCHLQIWREFNKAEITIGSGPYYGMIELIELKDNRTKIKAYGWGGNAIIINKWYDLLSEAP